MREEVAFQFAIALGDDTARLAYADWLEEKGDPRAAWVRDPTIWRWMAPDAHDPVPPLLEALTGHSFEEREVAAELLPRLRAGPEAILAVMLRCPERSYHAGLALSRMGAELGPIIPLLEKMVRTGGPCSHAAAVALSGVESAGATAFQGLLSRARRHLQLGVSRDVIAALGALGGADPEEAVAVLLRCLAEAGNGVERALAALGPSAAPLILREARALGQFRELSRVACALRLLGEPALPAIIAGLSDAAPGTRCVAVLACAASAPSQAWPALVRLLDEASGDWARIDLLCEFAAMTEEIDPGPALMRRLVLAVPVSEFPRRLADLVADLPGHFSDEDWPELEKALRSPSAGKRRNAVEAVGLLSSPSIGTRAAVASLLDNEDPEVREAAREAVSGWKAAGPSRQERLRQLIHELFHHVEEAGHAR
jgi:uncharacterized protein (TIGR02996 family)